MDRTRVRCFGVVEQFEGKFDHSGALAKKNSLGRYDWYGVAPTNGLYIYAV